MDEHIVGPESIHLSVFDGPLDLLLQLIEKAEIDIRDVFLSEVTAQYLAILQADELLDMDRSSEFITMGATLLYIKSNHLLPSLDEEAAEEIAETEEDLIRRLEEYKRFKDLTGRLYEAYKETESVYTRPAEKLQLKETETDLSTVTLEDLFAAMSEIAERVGRAEAARELHDVHQDQFTVKNSASKIRRMLQHADGGSFCFSSLAEQMTCKLEIVVTFMAMLDMMRNGEIGIRQDRIGGRIMVFRADKESTNG